MPDKPTYAVEATGTSLAILETLVDAEEPLGVTALSEHVDVAKSVVHNHLSTLQAHGYAVKRDGQYEPSLRMLALGCQTRDRIPVVVGARAKVDNLADATGETTTLFVIEADQAVPAYVAEPSNGWSPPFCEGERMPLHVNAPGKAILASLPDERVDEIISPEYLSAYADETTTDAVTLREQIAQIREDSVAFFREEQFDGVVGVASPIPAINGTRPAAIGVVGPGARLQGRHLQEDVTGQVLSTSKAIQNELTSN